MGTYPPVRDTGAKAPTSPHTLSREGKESSFGGAGRWACGRLASWCGKSAPRRRSVAGLRGRAATLGLRTAATHSEGSSEEFFALEATLPEQRRVPDDAFRRAN